MAENGIKIKQFDMAHFGTTFERGSKSKPGCQL